MNHGSILTRDHKLIHISHVQNDLHLACGQHMGGFQIRVGDLYKIKIKNQEFIFHGDFMIYIEYEGKEAPMKVDKLTDKFYNISLTRGLTYQPYRYTPEIPKLPIDPYILGVYLSGKYNLASNFMHENRDNVEIFKKIIAEYRMFVRGIPPKLEIDERIGNRHDLISYERQKKISRKPNVPDEYKYNSKAIRLQLIAAWLDTSGSLCEDEKSYNVLYEDERFSRDMVTIAKSVGFSLTFINVRPCYYQIRGNIEIPTILLPRKIFPPIPVEIKAEYIGEGKYTYFRTSKGDPIALGDMVMLGGF